MSGLSFYISLIAGCFVATALIVAVVCDTQRLRIPNAIPGCLIIAFVVYALIFRPDIDLIRHATAAGITFVLLFLLYLAACFGAGDVKLITAVMLWAGPESGLRFITLMALTGGAIAVLLLALSRLMRLYPKSARFLPTKVVRWSSRGVIPYSIPIAVAAFAVLPSILGLHAPGF